MVIHWKRDKKDRKTRLEIEKVKTKLQKFIKKFK